MLAQLHNNPIGNDAAISIKRIISYINIESHSHSKVTTE